MFAEWQKNSWYHGKISSASEKGYLISFDDGDERDCDSTQVVEDRVPAPAEVNVGDKVLARWNDDKFYPGSIKSIHLGVYEVAFDDGDFGRLQINGLRLRTLSLSQAR